jgi:RecA-family ATPase
MSETAINYDPNVPEIPDEVVRAIESWKRTIANATTPENRRFAFVQAVHELVRLAIKFTEDPNTADVILAELDAMAAPAGIRLYEAEAIITEVRDEIDGDHTIIDAWEQQDRRHNGEIVCSDEPPPPNEDDYGTVTASVVTAPGASSARDLKLNDPADFAGLPIPAREWLAVHRVPAAKVTLLSGDGGTGKSTIALQLVIATPYGDEWLGARIDKQGPAWFLSAEEDDDEIRRRLSAILDHQGRTLEDLRGKGVRWSCLDDESEYSDGDVVLGEADSGAGRVRKTLLYDALIERATEQRPALIVIENAADVFAINENDRSQVRQAVALLRRLAKRSGAAVVLIAHPSLYGLNSGSGTSGSTQWSNAVRSRLYFAAVKKGDDDESDIRELRVMKANYGPTGEAVRLCWHQGLFVPVGSVSTLERVKAEADIDQAYLDCLDAAAARYLEVGEAPGKAYAPTIFQKMPQARGFKSAALAAAQERLFRAGRIEVRMIGPSPSKRKPRIVRVPAP